MPPSTLVDGTDLDSWADRLDSQGLLPQLLRRLICASVGRVLRIDFRAGEGIQLGGWDGVVAVERGSAFVPDGVSAWEASTTKKIKGKADDDYEKRRKDPRGLDPSQCSLVFVTPRRWGGMDAWVAERQRDGVWREVRAYDADNLATWLELAPAVHIWLSILIGKHPEDATDLGTFWADWSEATRPAISPGLVLSGREDVTRRVREWLSGPPVSISLRGESREEALAVFAAILQQLPQEEQELFLSRTLVVHSPAGWNWLSASTEPLILIPTFESEEAISRATRGGHRVMIPLGRAHSGSNGTVTIPRLSREEAAKALVTDGVKEDRARDLAGLARRSLTSYRRKQAVNPNVKEPAWSHPENARHLLPAILAGAWSEAKEADRLAVAALAGSKYEEMISILVRWSNENDPPLRHVGDSWWVVSKEDAWSLLARHLTRGDLERFQEVAAEVLGTSDPAFALPPDQRWMAQALGHPPKHSDLLREGIADTLAAMGARGETVLVSDGVSASDFATRIVWQLLKRANADWRVWASLSSSLPLLTEGAPDTFLEAVQEGLAGEQPVLLGLFTDREDGLLGSSPHVGLLWALETLAWSPEHLGHAALLLAKLARIDPGGKLTNRPMSSLGQIFLPWHPQTGASLDQRLRVLDTLLEREPEVAWKLLRELLPVSQGFAMFTATPRWRDWAPDPSPSVTQREYANAVREIANRMRAAVGVSGPRWSNLIESLHNLPMDQHEAVVRLLIDMDVETLQPSDRLEIWNALRAVLSHHRSFPGARWALPRERVDRLDEIYQRLEPVEVIARVAWLFDSMPQLPQGRVHDWKALQEEIAGARLEAVRKVHAQAGNAGLLDLMKQVKQPVDLGITLGKSDLLERETDELLREHLCAGDVVRAQFARGFAAGRVWSRGREWATAKVVSVAKAWSPSQRAELIACLPLDTQTWNFCEDFDAETQKQYWRLVPSYGISDPTHVARVARKFLEHGRPYAAVDLLAFHTKSHQPPPPPIIAEALECAIRTSPSDDLPLNTFIYHVSELLDFLEASGGVGAERLASLEWALLPLLGRHERPPKILHRELARNPEFFAEIVAFAFRSETEERRDLSKEEQTRARHAYELLQSWRMAPGIMDSEEIDASKLTVWVRRAREITTGNGRRTMGDQMIGQFLSGSPVGPDGSWPQPAVRDVIEEVGSTQLERGIEVGLHNSRGMVTKHPYEGGGQERELAERYVGYAEAIRDRWSRTAAMLRRIADSYRAAAKREDQRAELREDLDR